MADSIKAEDAHSISALPDTVTDAHPLHMSMSGSLSSCSETFRADDIAEMDLQTSCTLSEEQYVTGNTMVEGRRHTDVPDALAANDDFPSFNFEQVQTCVSTSAIGSVASSSTCYCFDLLKMHNSILDTGAGLN